MGNFESLKFSYLTTSAVAQDKKSEILPTCEETDQEDKEIKESPVERKFIILALIIMNAPSSL